jgi:hypothetical protein
MQADVPQIIRPDNLVTGLFQNITDSISEDYIPQMTDMKGFMRIWL